MANPADLQIGEIQGVYEVCLGTPDLLAQIHYWQQFGYRIGQVGELSAIAAQALYGVDSSLRSVRLYHQQSDHGLVRLMSWEQPTGEGLGLRSMKRKGNRWATTLTADVANLWNHMEAAARLGQPIRYTIPEWSTIYPLGKNSYPFLDPLIGVRECLLLQPLTRQVLFQRFNYSLPQYGTISPTSPFQTSQITHVGLIIQDDSEQSLAFYDRVLGLLRVRDGIVDDYESNPAAQPIFDLEPGDRYVTTDFDDPRSSTDLQSVRSGRLKVIRFPECIVLEDQLEQSRPGCLGLCLYTYRVKDVANYWARVSSSNATGITEISANEFGEPSFSFIAPDGYFWTLVSDVD